MEGLRYGSRSVSNLVAEHRQGPTAEQWLQIKGVIQELYCQNGRPLKEVKVILARDYNFRATERMFKTRLSQWGLSKNANGKDYYALAILYQGRKDAGKSDTDFFIRDRKKTVAELRAYIRSKDMTEEEFLQAAHGSTVPPYIRCVTPDPGGTRTSPSSTSEDRPSPSPLPSSNGFQLTPGSSGSGSYPSPGYYPPARRRPTEKYHGSLAPETMSSSERLSSPVLGLPEQGLSEDYVLISGPSKTPSEVSSSSCDQIQQDVRTMALQVIRPIPLMSRYGANDIGSWVLVSSAEARDGTQDDGATCSKCHQALSTHYINMEGLEPSTQEPRSLLNSAAQHAMFLPSTTEGHGEAWRWMAFCFGACIHMSRGDDELSVKFLKAASAEFDEMLSKNDCLTLMSLNLLLSILHMHDQGSIAESIVQSALSVAERVLSTDNPIRVTIAWMVTVAGSTVQEKGLNGEVLLSLRQIHQTFERELGATSPTSIASCYNFAWMLCYENQWEEAEAILHLLYDTSNSALGAMHMQTIIILATLSRAQSRQGNYADAINTIQKAIRDSESTLGRNHPHRLESKRRLALMYQDIGKKEYMEELYWDVLKGRIKMLGAQHPWTKSAKEDLEYLLEELGKWSEDDSTQRLIDELFASTSLSSSEHEAY